MAPSSADMSVLRPDTCVSAILEFPPSSPIRDMQRITALFCALLHASGHLVRFSGQSANSETRIDTDDIMLSLARSEGSLAVRLDRKDRDDGKAPQNAETLLARLVRDACPVLRPDAIWWLDRDRSLPAEVWLSAFRPVKPRRVRADEREVCTPRPQNRGVPIWPNRPQDILDRHKIASLPDPSHEEETARRYAEWRPTHEALTADGKPLAEPLAYRLGGWTLAGVTAALCPPAGASMAVLNIFGRANLQRNVHALALTAAILALYQSGALAGAVRAVGL